MSRIVLSTLEENDQLNVTGNAKFPTRPLGEKIMTENTKLKNSALVAAGWASLVIIMELFSELTGIRKSEPTPKPRPIGEVIHRWPLFLTVWVCSFVIIFCWKYFREKTRISAKNARFEQADFIEVETFLGAVKSVTIKLSNYTSVIFIPSDTRVALLLLGINKKKRLKLARDPNGGPSAILHVDGVQVEGHLRVE
jgi:hypothetical protein